MLGPILLIVIGVLFLLNNLYPDTFRFGRMWPLILIVIGVTKILEYMKLRGSQPSSAAVIPRKEGE